MADRIWFNDITLEDVRKVERNTILEHLDIRFEELGPDFLAGSMPVDHRTVQPLRILHGGASVVLTETLGSMASYMTVDRTKFQSIGLEVNANHLKRKNEGSGRVYGVARPVRMGKKIHVWSIEVTDEEGDMVCISRLTMAIIPVR